MNEKKIPVEENRMSRKIKIKESPYKGNGMFAIEKIADGEELIIWRKGYTDAEGAGKARTAGKQFMQWDDNLFSIEEDGDDPAYCINHSCYGNTWMKDGHTLVAKGNIEAGEEVTADYALWEADESYISKWECKCGSSVCRKRITGKDWQLPELQARYENHFSPLINKRINVGSISQEDRALE